jgi:eukaryotic-like serine/threonine-protein kinase
MIQACAGLGYAHRAGLVHCDVKPHNMLVAPDGRLKVTDFGIARALATMTPGERTDVVWGSPLYFAPEQAQGEAPSPASDVYSLGVVMYELFSGTPPFTASTPDELARLHISARPIPLREYVPDIPIALEEIVSKVLSKEPAARYRTADQLGRVLQKFGTLPDALAHNPIPPAPAVTIAHPIAEKLPPKDKPLPPVQPHFLEPEIEAPQDTLDLGSAIQEIDWITVGLSLFAVIAVGGLIPFWMMVYFAWNPIVR